MRSSWETRFALWCDRTPSIIEWSSEETIIPYKNEVDGQIHRYFVDFKITVATDKGDKTYLIEVKPFEQTQPPRVPRSKSGRAFLQYQSQARTYVQNQCKWEAARAWAGKRGWEFKTITEYDLGLASHDK